MKKRTLIPDPIHGLLDVQTVTEEEETESYEVAPVAKIVEFYDPDFGPSTESTILNIYDGPRYGKLTLKELRKMCKDRKLKNTGTKKVLIDRLDEHTTKEKLELKKKQDKEDKVIRASLENKKRMLKVRIKNVSRQRALKLQELVKAQQEFDNMEEELNDMKVTLKSLDTLF